MSDTYLTAHRDLVQLIERTQKLSPEEAIDLVNDFSLAPYELSEGAKELINGYLGTLLWMAYPYMPPPPLEDLRDADRCPALESRLSLVYNTYYEAVSAYNKALGNYNSYGLWIRSFIFGPQPLLSKYQAASGMFRDIPGDLIVETVRSIVKGYLDDLLQEKLCVWQSKPPRPPPTVTEMLLGPNV